MPAPLSAAPGDYDPEAVKAQARAWVDGVNSASGVSGGWRLQVLRLRTRRKFDGGSPGTATDVNGDAVSSVGAHAPDGGCDELPARIRRFVPGCPWALVDQAVRYLYEIAPYTGIVYNGVKVEGKYRPTLTQWVRDDQTNVGERGANGTYTLVQDLIEVTDCDDSLEVATGASCSAYEETTFKWDADSVEPLPVECEQGVTWSLRAVSRSDEDGTYSYQLVKTTARTRHYGPTLVECGPQAEVTEESWESAYGEPGSFEARGCDVSGPIGAPACDSVPGVRTQVQYRENPDCTFDVVVRRRTSKEFPDSWCDGTACRPRDVSVVRNAKAVPPVPVPAIGESVERRLQRNEDNTYDVTDTVVRAAVPDDKSWTDGSCSQSTVHHAYDHVADVPSPGAGAPGVVKRASFRRNEDCTYSGEISTTVSSGGDKGWTEGVGCRPTAAHAYWNQKAVSISPPAGGETVSASVSRNADCTYDYVVKRTPAVQPDDKPWTDGSCSQSTVHHAYDHVADVPSPGAGGQGVVTRASFRRNEDCTYSGEVSTTTSSPDGAEWMEGVSCRPTFAYAHWNRSSVNIPAIPPGGSVSASVSRNADCTYDYVAKVTPAATPDDKSWTDGSCSQTTEHQLFDHVASFVSPGAGAPGVVKRASFRRNEDCTYSGEVATSMSQAKSSSDLVYASGPHTHTVKVYRNQPAPQKYDGASVCDSARNSFQMNDDCTYSGVAEKISFDNSRWQKDSGTKTWYSTVTQANGVTYKYRHTLRLFRGQDTLPTPPSSRAGSIHVSYDECGRYQGHYETTDLYQVSGQNVNNGVYGGIKTGTILLKRAGTLKTSSGERYDVRVNIAIYYGSGNEGSELSAMAAQVLWPGLQLPSNNRFRVYATGCTEVAP